MIPVIYDMFHALYDTTPTSAATLSDAVEGGLICSGGRGFGVIDLASMPSPTRWSEADVLGLVRLVEVMCLISKLDGAYDERTVYERFGDEMFLLHYQPRASRASSSFSKVHGSCASMRSKGMSRSATSVGSSHG